MAAEVAKKVSNVSEERTAEGRVADSENLMIEAAGRPRFEPAKRGAADFVMMGCGSEFSPTPNRW